MTDANKLDELEALLAKAAQGEWTMHSEPEVGLPPMLFAADTSKIYGNLTPIEPLIYDDLAAIVAAVNWCRDEGIALARQSAEQAARVAELEGEIERLREGLAKATTPSFYWDSEDSENGGDDLSVIMDNHDLGYVARLNCAASLPDRWAVGYVNDTGGFEAEVFLTEAEAVAFAAARAALKKGTDHE